MWGEMHGYIFRLDTFPYLLAYNTKSKQGFYLNSVLIKSLYDIFNHLLKSVILMIVVQGKGEHT